MIVLITNIKDSKNNVLFQLEILEYFLKLMFYYSQLCIVFKEANIRHCINHNRSNLNPSTIEIKVNNSETTTIARRND